MSTPNATEVVNKLSLADLMMLQVPSLIPETTFKLFGDYLVSEEDFQEFLQIGEGYPHGLISVMTDRLDIAGVVEEMISDTP